MTTDPAPRFASALSTQPNFERALGEALAELRRGLEPNPDLLAVFATLHHRPQLDELGRRLADATGAPVVVGCTGESVIGGGEEVERRPGLSVWAASLPGTQVKPFECNAAPDEERGARFSALPPIEDPSRAGMILLADPFSFPADLYLRDLDEAFPGVPAVGGMASGGMGPGHHRLFAADGARDTGLVGVVLEGDVELRPVVSQGCRPVGKPFVITACEENRIERLGGKPALGVLVETLSDLESSEQELFRRGPFVGLALDPTKSEFDRQDFLVRGVIGTDPQTQVVAVADHVRRGQTVQFLVRDAASAGDDLEGLMRTAGGGPLGANEAPNAAGALIFSCNGRGSRMFEEPHHDATRVRAGLSPAAAVAGFFAGGEIGPVAGRNCLHGFTASVAVLRRR